MDLHLLCSDWWKPKQSKPYGVLMLCQYCSATDKTLVWYQCCTCMTNARNDHFRWMTISQEPPTCLWWGLLCWAGLLLQGQRLLLAVEVPWEVHLAQSLAPRVSCRSSLTAASPGKFLRCSRVSRGGTGCLWSDSKALPKILCIPSVFKKQSTESSSLEGIWVNPFHKVSHIRMNFCCHKMRISRMYIHCRKWNTVLPLHLHYSVDSDVHLRP